MAEIKGTPLKDVVTVKRGDIFLGQEGDDEITLEEGSTGQGMAGNDILMLKSGANWATVWYWSSPSTIFVDLEAGYALDGYGTRDTLINIRNVHGFSRDGDKGYGSSGDDFFNLGPNWNKKAGTVFIDGRGGNDQAGMSYAVDGFGSVVLNVSADGRKLQAHYSNYPSFVYELRNIERFSVWDNSPNGRTDYDLVALRDLSHAGEQILLRGNTGWQTQALGSPITLTYSFMTQLPPQGGEGGVGFSSFTELQKQTIRDLFYVLQNQTGLAFSEVAGDAGQIRLGVNQQANTRGYSFIPDEFKADARAGDVWIDQETAAVMSPGQEGYYVLLHELAHALGLQHPLTEADTSGTTVLLNSFSSVNNTVMLDVSAASASGSWPTWFGSFDLQALRYLYGTRSFASGNDTYAVKDATSNMTIVDDGGMDTLDASNVGISVSIDLRGGKSSSIGMDTDGTSKFNNIAIAAGSLIENVMGSLYDDVIIGNAQNNLVTFIGGNDIVDGQEGVDIIRLWNKSTEFTVVKDTTTGYWNVAATNNTSGSIELSNVERLLFSDTSWALDTGDAQSAGRTAKILGAVFGKEGFLNLSFRGIGLYFLDNGWSYEALTQLALDARLGAGASKEIVAQLLQSNVPGLTLNSSEFISTTTMAIAAQDSNLNKIQINLVGITEAGLPFTLFG